jgi:predicted glycoside hydrolase/deacetylase ChbG (UPF0249 family)
MGPNPVLEKLGLKESDRVAILHVDDVGMCGASLDAFADLWSRRSVTCGSVMVPCPWFRATAAWAREHPDADLGVHATLTSEWPGYRWGPVSTRDPASGLMDGELCFPRTSAEVARDANPAAVGKELALQLSMAREAGILPTHLDTHMGSVMDAGIYGAFVQSALDAGVPPFGLRLGEDQWRKGGYDGKTAAILADTVERLEASGVPMLDRIFQLSLSIEDDRAARTRDMVDKIAPGQIGYVVFHPALDTAELRAICPDWRSRVSDHELLASGTIRRHLEDQGVTLIGCRELRDLMPEKH